MKTFNFNIAIKFTVLSVITALFFFACRKTSDLTSPIDPVITIIQPDLTKKVNSSVSGFVTNENNMAVKDASVLIGTTTVLTDKYGYFEARNVQMVQNAAVVTVSKSGFFKSIKTYIATANKAAFFRVKLIPKTSVSNMNGAVGGIVTFAGGLSINFPAASVMNASTNTVHTGIVNVTAFYINPTAVDLNSIMPGDLRGLNTDGELKLLTTYGMAAVELTGASGELLQIATGKKATITMPIPTTLSGTAPATIPLWYFNETNGLWKQEGSAAKTGNTYIGEVNHFSFWNCDVPNNYVQFNCTVVNTTGQPLQNAFVKLSLVSNPLVAAYGHTDSSGYVSGAVPNNAQLKLEVFANSNCGSAAFSQIFTTTNINVAYGNVAISNANIATISGNIINCSGSAVTNGYVILQSGMINERYTVDASGNYVISKILCISSSPNFTIYGVDASNAQVSNSLIYTLVLGSNLIPNIQACNSNAFQEYLNLTVNGISYNYTSPIDSLSSINLPNFRVIGNRIPFLQTAESRIIFNGSLISQGGITNLIAVNCPQFQSSTTTFPINVFITELGTIGQFMAGNFSGVMIGPAPTNTLYNTTCNFRVRRI